jgi:hypothetical protein
MQAIVQVVHMQTTHYNNVEHVQQDVLAALIQQIALLAIILYTYFTIMAVLLYVQLAHIKAELLACYAVLHAKHVEILIQTVLHVYHPFSILIMDAEILALLVLIIIMEHVQHANLVV